jgi:electron transfer flavoprotein beta subunit
VLLFGGCASAARDAGVVMQMVGERLGIQDQFVGVDELQVQTDGGLLIKERAEGGRYLASLCQGPPLMAAWATGHLPEPPNNPQTGMQNMRTIMPALQRATPVTIGTGDLSFSGVEIPQARRDTRIVENMPVEEIAREIVEWLTT